MRDIYKTMTSLSGGVQQAVDRNSIRTLLIPLVFFLGFLIGSIIFFVKRSRKTIIIIGPYGGEHERENPYRTRDLTYALIFLFMALIWINCFISCLNHSKIFQKLISVQSQSKIQF